MKFRSQSLYYTSRKKRVIISMKSLMKRSKKLKVRRRTAIKNQKKDLERTWTQQRQPGRTQVSVCSSEYHPATIPDIHF